jgi:predicted kinase
MVILVSGLPGSGKSFFAEKLAARLDAYYLSSDRIRKEVFKHPTYTEEEKKAVYSEMKRRLIALLKTDSSKNIILDATFFKEDLRKTFCRESITYKTTCKTFIITANDEDIQERVKQKRAYSDADYSVHLKLKEQFEWPQSDYLVLDSSCLHINQMLDQAVAYLKTL